MFDWVNAAEAVGAMLGGGGTFVAYFVWREGRKDRRRASIDDQIAHAIQPLRSDIDGLSQTMRDHVAQEAGMIQAAVERGLHPVATELAVLKAQVLLYWQGTALDSASVIHQPDPRRRHIDDLIDALRDESITPGQLAELRKYLETIRDWEPGQDVGFPVLQGEQASAVQLLNTMAHASPEQKQ
jgi:hypothetical protein